MNKTRILLVEDDPNLGLILRKYLESKQYDCKLYINGQSAYDVFINSENDFDILLLDIMMPIKDGFTLAKEIRNIDKKIPIIFLSAKTMKEDILHGYEIGVDDFITKPFSMEILEAKINALLCRTKVEDKEKNQFEIGNYKFNYDTKILSINSNEKKLSTKESKLLKILLKNISVEVSRSSILKLIWGDDNYFTSRSMDVYITKLRKYLAADEKIEIINIHGKGFKIIELS